VAIVHIFIEFSSDRLGKVLTINSSAPQAKLAFAGMRDDTTIFATIQANVLRKTKDWIAAAKDCFNLSILVSPVVGRNYRLKSFPTIREYLKEIISHRISLLKMSLTIITAPLNTKHRDVIMRLISRYLVLVENANSQTKNLNDDHLFIS
jgi:hypothetical protein